MRVKIFFIVNDINFKKGSALLLNTQMIQSLGASPQAPSDFLVYSYKKVTKEKPPGFTTRTQLTATPKEPAYFWNILCYYSFLFIQFPD